METKTKDYAHTITRLNGNKRPYTTGIPKLCIAKFGNETAKEWFIKNTGLELKDKYGYYEAQPKTFKQIYKVFAVYNWKTRYFNNASSRNTLFLAHNTEWGTNPFD
jgi:hypothetical protein